jgi:hypothetical protein
LSERRDEGKRTSDHGTALPCTRREQSSDRGGDCGALAP